jgi:hypothetical protein
MMTSFRTLSLLFVVPIAGFAAQGCDIAGVSDADLKSGAIAAFDVTATDPPANTFAVDVSGSATLAYTSSGFATLEFFVNGKSVHEEDFDASANPAIAFAVTLPLDFEDANEVTAELTYAGSVKTKALTVQVPFEPMFDCTDAAAMLPTNTLVGQNGFETRTLLGYFGDPANGHTVTAVIDYDGTDGWHYQEVGNVIVYGRETLTVEFSVNHAECANAPCDVPYGLTVYVDEAQVCTNASYGVIKRL